jgi:hypothetical protein
MAEFTINTREFTSNPFSWEAVVKKFDDEGKEKNYKIEDGNLVTPVEVEYKLEIYKVDNLNSYSVSAISLANNKTIVSEKTEEDFYTALENNEEILTSYVEWMNGRNYDGAYSAEFEKSVDKEMFFSSAVKLTKIRPFITDKSKYEKLEESFRPIINDWIVIEREKINTERIVEIFDAHPKKQSIIDRIKEREEEMKRLIIESQQRDSETVRRNNYEMWKALNQKFSNGEFDDYIVEPRD